MSKWLLIFSLVFSAPGYSENECSGEDFASLVRTKNSAASKANLANAIEEHPRPIETYELDNFGKVVNSSDDLKNLKDGAYLYVIDESGNVVISPRFSSFTDEKILVTHPALTAKLAENFGKQRVAAAGEFYIDGGVVSEFNNKSGRYWGKKEHLDYAMTELKGIGLDIKPGTKIVDVSSMKNDPGHQTEKQVVTLIQEKFKNNPALVKEFEGFVTDSGKVASHPALRSETAPGKVDVKKLIKEYISFVSRNPNNRGGADLAIWMLGNYADESTRHFHPFFSVLRNEPEAKRRAALEIIKVIGETGSFPK